MKYFEAKYLKHVGETLDVKITIKIIDKDVLICIRDYEFSSTDSAMKYLRAIADNEMMSYTEEEIELNKGEVQS